MQQYSQINEYDQEIKHLKRIETIVIIITFVLVIIAAILCKSILSFILSALCILLVEFVVLGKSLSSLTTAMDVECDPQKHMALNEKFQKNPANMNSIYTVDLFYMGQFEDSIVHANKMIEDKNPEFVFLGLFNKARCEFFMNDMESFYLTLEKFKEYSTSMKEQKQQVQKMNQEICNSLLLLEGIARKESDKISNWFNIEVWNNSKATKGYIDFIKGMAAFYSKDTQNANNYFMAVKDNCQKTFLAPLAEQYLNIVISNIDAN